MMSLLMGIIQYIIVASIYTKRIIFNSKFRKVNGWLYWNSHFGMLKVIQLHNEVERLHVDELGAGFGDIVLKKDGKIVGFISVCSCCWSLGQTRIQNNNNDYY